MKLSTIVCENRTLCGFKSFPHHKPLVLSRKVNFYQAVLLRNWHSVYAGNFYVLLYVSFSFLSFPFPCEHVTFHANNRTNKFDVCLSFIFVVCLVPNVLGLAEDKPTSTKFFCELILPLTSRSILVIFFRKVWDKSKGDQLQYISRAFKCHKISVFVNS